MKMHIMKARSAKGAGESCCGVSLLGQTEVWRGMLWGEAHGKGVSLSLGGALKRASRSVVGSQHGLLIRTSGDNMRKVFPRWL
jgi:hypothetical protein